jgi:hypothetical protein
VGDGVTDDTAALQRAFDSAKSGQTIRLASGKTYRHTQVLTLRTAGVHLSGPGTLLATAEATSSVFVDADNVTLDGGLTLRMGTTTRRWDANEQMKLHIGPHSGDVVRNVTIDGAAAAGIYIDGASHYLLADDTVKNTRADGIHNTGGSHDGIITRATVRNVGDDGIAVVSYGANASQCYNITVQSPRFYGNTWGRAFSVVGGHDITWTDVYAQNSNAAAIYVAAEGYPYYTYAPAHIKVIGGTLVNSNTNPAIDHGAILVYVGRAGYTAADIDFENIAITNTRSSASGQVGIIAGPSASVTQIQFKNITITGGPASLFGTNVPRNTYNIVGWKYDGVAQLAHVGW